MNKNVRLSLCLFFHAQGCVTLLAILATQVIELRWERRTFMRPATPVNPIKGANA
jgi:hypothetical protein